MDASMCVCLAPRGDVAGAPVAPSPTPAPRIPHARPANRSVPARHMGHLRCRAASETEGPPPSCRTCMHGALNAWRASVWQRRVCSCSLEVSMCIHAPLWQPAAACWSEHTCARPWPSCMCSCSTATHPTTTPRTATVACRATQDQAIRPCIAAMQVSAMPTSLTGETERSLAAPPPTPPPISHEGPANRSVHAQRRGRRLRSCMHAVNTPRGSATELQN